MRISSQQIDKGILDELREIKKSLQDTERRVVLEKLTPQQTTNSPYFPDRAYSNPLAVKGNPEETSWKEVKTYEETREIDIDTTSQKHAFASLNGKKLNII
ncbi:hypothetical protein [Bacteriovorax sp. Seq25_V]|uniref:hypothetical protein n=1 Tax=Bacteriovorax sp. Seq25_V TaxID=1201288 RepID=UPI000389F1C2|nr:hypothetical protein [Bacteriovorax sp. Seq25_V]EQC44258.1 hypothetical protein M900_A0353 [Bacteriovorax sp. Seq25_V]